MVPSSPVGKLVPDRSQGQAFLGALGLPEDRLRQRPPEGAQLPEPWADPRACGSGSVRVRPWPSWTVQLALTQRPLSGLEDGIPWLSAWEGGAAPGGGGPGPPDVLALLACEVGPPAQGPSPPTLLTFRTREYLSQAWAGGAQPTRGRGGGGLSWLDWPRAAAAPTSTLFPEVPVTFSSA